MDRENDKKEQDILTLKEAASLLRISYSTLRNWIKEGKVAVLKEKRTYRIKRTDLEKRFRKQS